jgi:vomeronasal1 receptor
LNNPSLFFVNSSAIVTACFPTISPFLLMSRDSRISRLCFAEKRNTNSPTPRKKM